MRQDPENTVKLAVIAVQEQEYSSIRRAAEAYGISHSTLWRQLKGITKSNSGAHEEQQLLTIPEEKAVVSSCQALVAMGFSIQYRMLQSIAGYMLRKRLLPATTSTTSTTISTLDIGVTWHKRFLNRHPEISYKHTQ